jgi:hypothetical protein
MKSIADLKRRLVKGAAVVLDTSTLKGAPCAHKYLNVPRFVTHVQGNSFCLHPDPAAPRPEWSWMDWPKREEVAFDEDGEGFTITSKNGAVVLHYRILPKEA